MNKDYFKPEPTTLYLCECEKDMLAYALNHVDWSEYNAEDYGGESADVAANIHFNDILQQLDRDV